jgi:hypothetical protein
LITSTSTECLLRKWRRLLLGVFGRSTGVEFRHPLHPQVRLVLGADKNEIWFAGREIRLTKWDRYAFAQGVVWLAFEDLMPSQQRLTIAKRAVTWADSTVEIERLAK